MHVALPQRLPVFRSDCTTFCPLRHTRPMPVTRPEGSGHSAKTSCERQRVRRARGALRPPAGTWTSRRPVLCESRPVLRPSLQGHPRRRHPASARLTGGSAPSPAVTGCLPALAAARLRRRGRERGGTCARQEAHGSREGGAQAGARQMPPAHGPQRVVLEREAPTAGPERGHSRGGR